MSKIFPRFPQWISPRILLPIANLGEIPGKIALRFLPPWICSLARISARFAVAFRRDFGRRDYCFLVRILVRFAAGIAPRFWLPGFLLPGEILATRIFASRQESWWNSWQDPGKILVAGNFVSWWESCQDPCEIPVGKKNPGSQNLARIPTGFLPRSRRDPVKILVLILQGNVMRAG